MVIFGGELANGSLASDVWMYRPLTDDWQQLGFSSSRGAPRLANHAAAVVDVYLYVFGGGCPVTQSPRTLVCRLWNDGLCWRLRSHRGGHVLLLSPSVRPTRQRAVGDCLPHRGKAPGDGRTLDGVPRPLQNSAGLRGPQADNCQVPNADLCLALIDLNVSLFLNM